MRKAMAGVLYGVVFGAGLLFVALILAVPGGMGMMGGQEPPWWQKELPYALIGLAALAPVITPVLLVRQHRRRGDAAVRSRTP